MLRIRSESATATVLDRRCKLYILDPLRLMNTHASRRNARLARLLRGLAWVLCMLVASWSATARFAAPVARVVTASFISNADGRDAEQNPDGDPWEAEDSDQEADSDHGSEEIPILAVHELWIAVFATSELTTLYSGKARPGFSSPEPRPAESV
jgi:hypothetical protein